MLKYYGADICPDCVEAHALLAQKGIAAEFVDITANTANLKAFLALRDSRPEFEPVKQAGGIGIPAFVWEDGRLELGCEWMNETT